MQKKLQKKLDLHFSKNVIDIVQFGSSVLDGEKPNDIDIAVIYEKISVKDQLEQSQEIKRQLEAKFAHIPIHIKSYDLYSFFDKGNFAKDSIMIYGKSLITGDYFSKLFGLEPTIVIRYHLLGLEKKDKIRFNYMLNGKKGKYGLLREYEGKLVGPGVIEIRPECEKIFCDSINDIISKFSVEKMFVVLE